MAHCDAPATSEVLARAMGSNPVVVRRILAGLRERGFVRSEKGHGGGWTFARSLEELTLREIYEAIGSPGFFAMGNRAASPSCLVEKAVNAALDDSFREAEQLLLQRLGEVTLAALSMDFDPHMASHRASTHLREKLHDR